MTTSEVVVNYYEILELSQDATEEQVRKHYKKLALKHHPDKNGGQDEHFKKVGEAYEILNDPARRWIFNSKLSKRFPQGYRFETEDSDAAESKTKQQPPTHTSHQPSHQGPRTSRFERNGHFARANDLHRWERRHNRPRPNGHQRAGNGPHRDRDNKRQAPSNGYKWAGSTSTTDSGAAKSKPRQQPPTHTSHQPSHQGPRTSRFERDGYFARANDLHRWERWHNRPRPNGHQRAGNGPHRDRDNKRQAPSNGYKWAGSTSTTDSGAAKSKPRQQPPTHTSHQPSHQRPRTSRTGNYGYFGRANFSYTGERPHNRPAPNGHQRAENGPHRDRDDKRQAPSNGYKWAGSTSNADAGASSCTGGFTNTAEQGQTSNQNNPKSESHQHGRFNPRGVGGDERQAPSNGYNCAGSTSNADAGASSCTGGFTNNAEQGQTSNQNNPKPESHQHGRYDPRGDGGDERQAPSKWYNCAGSTSTTFAEDTGRTSGRAERTQKEQHPGSHVPSSNPHQSQEVERNINEDHERSRTIDPRGQDLHRTSAVHERFTSPKKYTYTSDGTRRCYIRLPMPSCSSPTGSVESLPVSSETGSRPKAVPKTRRRR